MAELFQTILRELKAATGATKALAGLVAAAVVAAIGITAVVSNRPDLQPAFSELSSAEMSAVTRALSEAGIDFEVSHPPYPFVVFVDDGQRSAAMAAAYGAGALEKPISGILPDQGAASIFLGSEERQQAVRKREWQETEGMLEQLDFVVTADVRTSPGDPRPLLGRPSAPTTASVTLRLAGREPMTEKQSHVVSRLVSRGLGIQPKHIAISDQLGTLYDGAEAESEDLRLGDLLSYKRAYDEELTSRANAALDRALGPGRAYVVVDSAWDFDQSVTRTETAAKGGVLSEDSVKTEQPLDGPGAVGGVAGVSANVATSETAGAAPAPGQPGAAALEPRMATSEETRTQYVPSRTFDETVRSTPQLKRLSVALVVADSVDDATLTALERLVGAAVNLDPSRQDTLTAERLPMLEPEAVPAAEAGETETPEPSDGPSPLIETLLTRGVEIVTAVVFLFLLLRSLRSSDKATRGTPQPATVRHVDADGNVYELPAGQDAPVDAELLARMQVERLLESDPERVGEILSSWARGEDAETGAAA